METIYDWLTIAMFAGLMVLFLQRSVSERQTDRMIDYLPPALCCALGNYLGNNGQHVLAVMAILVVPVYTWFVLKPFAK